MKENRASGGLQSGFRANLARIGQHVMIARQQQMIAVVDGQIGCAVEIRAAAAADLLRRLVHMHDVTSICQTHASRQPGDTGTEDMNRSRHQITAYRARIINFAAVLRRTGSRGSANPRATSRSRMA